MARKTIARMGSHDGFSPAKRQLERLSDRIFDGGSLAEALSRLPKILCSSDRSELPNLCSVRRLGFV